MLVAALPAAHCGRTEEFSTRHRSLWPRYSYDRRVSADAVDQRARLLLEREDELAALGTLLGGARGGQGRVAVVEGPAGIGKSRLLEAARAAAVGFTVLRARGGELERDFPWGVVRQLFEAQVVFAGQDRRDAVLGGAAAMAAEPLGLAGGASGPGDATFAALHGLYWLTVNLASAGPVLLCVDDAQWADAPSLRFLAYLGARVDELPVLILAGQRPRDAGSPLDLAADAPEAALVYPAELSETAVATLVGERLGTAAPEFVTACHRASGGNPFLLGELLTHMASIGARPSAAAAVDVEDLGPRSVARAVLRRVARLSADAVTLARDVAILGTDVEMRLAAALAGLDEVAAAAAADGLAAAQILRPGRPLDFVHPVVRAAVRDDIPAGDRIALHRKAARLLADAGSGPGRVAVHLLATEPAGDPWTAEILRAAAGRAFSRGAPEAAAEFLRRAIAEPPPAGARSDVLRQLGRASLLGGDITGAEHYRAAMDAALDPVERAAIGRELGVTYVPQGQYEQAVSVLEQARADAAAAGDLELARLAEADLITAGRLHPNTLARTFAWAEGIDPDSVQASPAGRCLLGALAFHGVVAGWPTTRIAGVARRAADAGLPIDPATSNTLWDCGFALAVADELDAADAWWQAILAAARERGSVLTFARCSCFLALTALHRGDVLAAEAHARASLEAAAGQRWFLVRMATAMLIEALVERAALGDAQAALEAVEGGGDIGDYMMLDFLLYARGRLRIARGEIEAGLADLYDYGHRPGAVMRDNPAVRPWRSEAALAELTLGRPDEARHLAEAERELAQRIRSDRAIGVATRALGLVEGGRRGAALLEAAVDILGRSHARLEHARALVDLGAARRRAGNRAAAREPLRHGLDIAQRLGAHALAEQAIIELRAAGGRPRRRLMTGAEALTASEYRVAQMAAQGLTNREIAQALFVTTRNVELHLTHAYGKLGIASRTDLATALAGE